MAVKMVKNPQIMLVNQCPNGARTSAYGKQRPIVVYNPSIMSKAGLA